MGLWISSLAISSIIAFVLLVEGFGLPIANDYYQTKDEAKKTQIKAKVKWIKIASSCIILLNSIELLVAAYFEGSWIWFVFGCVGSLIVIAVVANIIWWYIPEEWLTSDFAIAFNARESLHQE
jgi:hypothetical protein